MTKTQIKDHTTMENNTTKYTIDIVRYINTNSVRTIFVGAYYTLRDFNYCLEELTKAFKKIVAFKGIEYYEDKDINYVRAYIIIY